MALVLESVSRPKQAHLHDLSRREGADTGSGEAFADALSRAGSRNTEGSDPAQVPQIAAPGAPQTAAPPNYESADIPAGTGRAGAASPLAPHGKDNTAPHDTALPLTGSDPAQVPQIAAPGAPQTGAATGSSTVSPDGKGDTGLVRNAAKPGSGAAPAPADTSRLSDTPNADAGLTSAAGGPAPLSAADTSAVSDPSAETGQSGLSLSMATYTAPSGPATAAPVLAPTGLTPAHAMIVAAPAQVVDIVSSAADDGQSDSIIVQLDPPELGRVSIDFKFDANGLQHVTITGESPEAMRQLRLMHFELIQALERHGIGSSNMTFQQQQQNTQQSPLPNPFAGEPVKGRPGTAEASVPVVPPYSLSSPRTLPGGRLDMKL